MTDARRYLPLTPQQFHILLALTQADRHGYGIIREIDDHTGGEMRLGTGTLYTAIARLDQLGLVAESPSRPRPARDDERRRYYRLTRLGRDVLEAETARLDVLVRHARRHGIRPTARAIAASRTK